MTDLVYLASPYSHPSPGVRQARFEAVCQAAAQLMALGRLHVFSPIAHTHSIAEAGNLPTDWAYWRAYDYTMLQVCARVIVLALDGWDESAGIRAESAIAQQLGLPICVLRPEEVEAYCRARPAERCG